MHSDAPWVLLVLVTSQIIENVVHLNHCEEFGESKMSVHIHVQNVEYNFSGLGTFGDWRGSDAFVVISLFELKESSRGVEKVAFSQYGIFFVVATVLPGSTGSFHGLRHVQVELGVDLSR